MIYFQNLWETEKLNSNTSTSEGNDDDIPRKTLGRYILFSSSSFTKCWLSHEAEERQFYSQQRDFIIFENAQISVK